MKAHLLYPDKDFNWPVVRGAAEARRKRLEGWYRRDDDINENYGLPWYTDDFMSDLSLDILFKAMAGKDNTVYEASRRIVLESTGIELESIKYRQDILDDCLKNQSIVRQLYDVANKALEKQQEHYFGDYTRNHADAMLGASARLLQDFLGSLRELHDIAELNAPKFKSKGWTQFFAMLKMNLDSEYLTQVEYHLKELNNRAEAVLLSANLGRANKGINYLLHPTPHDQSTRWSRTKSLFSKKGPVYAFKLHPRDNNGFEALKELRERGMGSVAAALGQSADNVSDFFGMLQVELAFYVGCINLHKKLKTKGQATCRPIATAANQHSMSFKGLYEICMSLSTDQRVVSNDLVADGKNLVIITGTNTGGKSTFLRSIGLAQLMMQAGMFVPAKEYSSSICDGLFTHYKREEDVEMDSGKFDEELSRMSRIIDHIQPYSMVLFNESFSATNEREGSEIARQITSALLDSKVKVLFVTHQYELARSYYEKNLDDAIYLRAERKADGTRTFKIKEGKPLQTSFGPDIYKKVFGRQL